MSKEKSLKVRFEYVKKKEKGFMDLEDPTTFDTIQRRFCVAVCLKMICKIYNVIVIVRSFATNCSLEQEYIATRLQYFKKNKVYH